MTVPARPLRLLTRALAADGRLVDVVLDGPAVVDVLPAGTAPLPADPAATLDLEGFLLLTAPAEPHAHLDKARTWNRGQAPATGLTGAIETWRTYARTMTRADVEQRAYAQATVMLANGTTAIRSHVDVLHGDDALRGIEGVAAARDRLEGLLDIELVALAKYDVPDADIEAALDGGADVLGGSPHIAPDPGAELRRLLKIAERRGVPVDLHTDESLGGPVTLGEFALLVRGWPQNVSAGHCVRLATMPANERQEIVREAVASDIGIIANPITNLYLLGRDIDGSAPRGITAARAVIDAGGRFAAGADNVRDPFNPVGRSDAFETAMLLVVAAHLTVDEAWAAVSSGARDVLALPEAGLRPGACAEFLAVQADSLADAIASAPAERRVIHQGRLVASTQVSVEVFDPV
jgi:cytosine/creatinine deaminase